MFITDGYDRNNDLSTETVTQKISMELKTRNIISKFSVLGLGEHDSGKVIKILDLGLFKGPYYYINNYQTLEENISSITSYFEETLFEMNIPPGFLVTFKDQQKKYYFPFEEEVGEKVFLRIYNLITT